MIFLRNNYVNSGRGQYDKSIYGENIIAQTRNKLKQLFRSKNYDVVFTPSATIAINTILQGIYFNIIKLEMIHSKILFAMI